MRVFSVVPALALALGAAACRIESAPVGPTPIYVLPQLQGMSRMQAEQQLRADVRVEWRDTQCGLQPGYVCSMSPDPGTAYQGQLVIIYVQVGVIVDPRHDQYDRERADRERAERDRLDRERWERERA